jgi:hypothetical protein
MPAILIAVAFGAPCFAQAPITEGLVARWIGDGNAKDSAGHFDGTVSGSLDYVPGPAAALAFHFGGGGGSNLYGVQGQLATVTSMLDEPQIRFQNVEPRENNRAAGPPPQSGAGGAKVDFGNEIGNFGTRDFTIAYWMKTDSKDPWDAFLSKRSTCDARSFFWEIRVGGRDYPVGVPKLALSGEVNKDPFYLRASRALNDGQWHHVAWVRQSTSSGTSTGLIYVDGALDNSTNYPDVIDLTNQSPLVLGQDVCQCCDGTRPYSGAVAELQLFSHALTADEILTIYKAQKQNK